MFVWDVYRRIKSFFGDKNVLIFQTRYNIFMNVLHGLVGGVFTE